MNTNPYLRMNAWQTAAGIYFHQASMSFAADSGSEGQVAHEVHWWSGSVGLLERIVADPFFRNIALGILVTFVVALALWLVFRLTDRALQKACAKLESWRGTRIPPLKIQSYEILSAERITDVLKSFARALRVAALAIAFYIAIPVILSAFPWSRGWAERLLPYLVAPIYAFAAAFVGFLPNLFSIIVILIATRYLVRINRALFGEIEKETIVFPGFHAEWAQPTSKLLSFIIVIFAVVLISPYLPGFGSPAFQGISIFLGVLLSLGSTAAIANIVAGTALTYMRPFKLGDRVKIADTVGDVTEKTLLITRLRTVKNVEVTIPNAMVLGNHMINFSALAEQDGLVLHTTVTIGYDQPWRRVHELLLGAARDTEHVEAEPPPFVLQTGLNDYSIAYELNAYTRRAADAPGILSRLHENIQDRFNAAGVEILSPGYTALRDGNDTTLPEEYLPKGSEAKGFRFRQLTGGAKPRE